MRELCPCHVVNFIRFPDIHSTMSSKINPHFPLLKDEWYDTMAHENGHLCGVAHNSVHPILHLILDVLTYSHDEANGQAILIWNNSTVGTQILLFYRAYTKTKVTEYQSYHL